MAVLESARIVRGTLDETGTLHLSEPVRLPPGEVEVIIRPARSSVGSNHSMWDVVAESHFEVPDEELMAGLRALRDEWER